MFPDPEKFGIKICGITTAQQAADVLALGADALGLNFWPKSKRYLAPVNAAWAPELRSHTCIIGVTVNPTDADLVPILDAGLIDILQLHGDESPERTAELLERGIPVIKALQVRDESSLGQIGHFPCETLLLDAYNPGLYGGVGHTFPWELAVMAQHRFPEKRFILSGGLNHENVHTAVEQTHPAAVDVASGVESSPGVKDLEKTRWFIEQARSAAKRME